MSLRNRIERLDSVPDKFISVVNKQNETIFKNTLKLLDDFETKDGLILQNDRNFAIIEKVMQNIKDTLFEGEYLEAVKEFISEFSEQAELVNAVYKNFGLDDAEKLKPIIKQSQRTALELLDQNAIDANILKPLKDKLTTSLLNEAKHSEIISLLQDTILGSPGIDPKMTAYVKRYARDVFAVYDRTYSQIVAKDVKIEYYEYAGGLLQDSRDFCKERVGRRFRIDEIKSWASLDWQGKNPATDENTIMAYLGGYNCIHTLIPVKSLEIEE